MTITENWLLGPAKHSALFMTQTSKSQSICDTWARVCNISVATGVVVRPLWVDPMEHDCVMSGPFVDTMAMHRSDTLRMLNLRKPERDKHPLQFMCLQMWMIPYGLYDQSLHSDQAACGLY